MCDDDEVRRWCERVAGTESVVAARDERDEASDDRIAVHPRIVQHFGAWYAGFVPRVARWIWDHPGAQLVLGALVVAVAFPATAAGSISLAILAAGTGIMIARYWPDAPPWLEHPGRWASALVLVAVACAGLSVFWDTLTQAPDWQMGDWGPQHAVLARLMPSLPGLDVPTWNHAVSTGDAPLELYPALTYLVVGHLALLLGIDDLSLAFMIVATLTHLALAIITTYIAMRVTSRKIALAIGLFWLVDGGAISHGGTVGLYRWAILHSAFAHVFSMIAVIGILAALRRPRIGAAVTIWLATAVATAAHPAALLMAAACAVGLLGVALLAADTPPRRAFAALAHLAIGVALGALVWLPASERLLAYGEHFSNELYSASHFLQTIMAFAMPISVYSAIIYAGYLGMIAALFSRRADLVLLGVISFALIIGLCDVPYLGLGLLPSRETARLGVIRMMLLVRPCIYVCAAYMLWLVGQRCRTAWRDAPARQRTIAAALLGITCGLLLRIVPTYWREESQRAFDETRVYAPDADGRKELTAWAIVQMSQLGPSRWARALFEQDTHEQLHLTATTGLPTLHMGALPDLLLRERIEDTSRASLARFNVRWVIGVDQSPSLGDPDSELVIGTYHIREVAGWDGKFARIERGKGNVTVTRLDDRAVEIEVTNTTQPVLVALGTGYYPRWRARHASGAAEPVYALPSIEGGTLHVVSAWVAPGRTIFTCDGPLPSDGHGRLVALAAALVALAGVIAWTRTRWRIRILRRLAFARHVLLAYSPWLVRAGVPLVVLVLLAKGCATTLGPARAFMVGTGVRGQATVEARLLGGEWTTCDYVRIRGEYDCEGLVVVNDGTANIVTDAPPSWAYITPAVIASAYSPGVEVRISRTLHLAGRYWAAASSAATIEIEGQKERDLEHKQVMELAGERAIHFTASVPFPNALKITFVAEDTLEPPRPFLAAPPDVAPQAVRAIR